VVELRRGDASAARSDRDGILSGFRAITTPQRDADRRRKRPTCCSARPEGADLSSHALVRGLDARHTLPEPIAHGLEEDPRHLGEQPRVAGHGQPQRPRQRQHPLTHGHRGPQPRHLLGGGLAHATPAARRAHPASLARKRHQPVEATRLTARTPEAAGQHPAAQKGPQLGLDVRRQCDLRRARRREEGLQLGLHDVVQHGVGRRARHVGRWALRGQGIAVMPFSGVTPSRLPPRRPRPPRRRWGRKETPRRGQAETSEPSTTTGGCVRRGRGSESRAGRASSRGPRPARRCQTG
jgi:hypothetical protein